MRLRSSLIWLVGASVIPIAAFGFVVATLLLQHEQDNFVRAVKDRNRAFMSAVDAELAGHIRTLQALGSLRSLSEGDLAQFHSEAVAALHTQRDWENVILNAPDGAQLVNAVTAYGEPLPTGNDRASVRDVVKSSRPLVVSLRIRPLTNTLAIPVRVPIQRDGQVMYVLTAVVRPESFERLIRQQNVPEGWVSGLVDAEGRFIARVPARRVGSVAGAAFLRAVAHDGEGWYRGETVEGLDTYTAFLRSDFTGWSIGLAIPTALVRGGERLAFWTLIGAVLCLLCAIVGATWIGHRIARPIATLAAKVEHLDANPRIDFETDIEEVGHLATALHDASQAIAQRRSLAERERKLLEEADRAKDAFLAMLSHELRNPLAGIVTATQLLKLAPSGSDVAVKAQGIIERQTQQMTRLIEDLLEVSRIAIGKPHLNPRPMDLAELVQRVAETWRHSGRLSGRQLFVDAPSPAWVMADPARIEQVLANLLDNAVKFSPLGSAIRLELETRDSSARLVVRDEGIGLAPDQLERVFGLFVQGPQGMDRSLGGLGIGLFVVKRIVDMHHGTVTAESAGSGHGSRFVVTLPLMASASNADDATARPAQGSGALGASGARAA